MKITAVAALIAASLFCLTSCGSPSSSDFSAAPNNNNTASPAGTAAAPADTSSENTADETEIIDLTAMDSSMVYAQVFDMVNSPDDYVGKTVIAKGPFSYYKDEVSGNEYFAVLINDATACCSQGLEFVLDGEHSYPEDYPEIGTEITVTGEFNYYNEDYITYCQLLHPVVEADNKLSWS